MAGRTGGGSSGHCTIYYDGASKGNPGRSGGGAVIHSDDGSAYRVREGFGTRTNNAAEYGALNRGLQFARDQGYEHVTVRGDSQLVHRQITGEYETRNPNLQELRSETIRLSNGFKSFQSEHVPRGYNRDADSAANDAVGLRDGEVRVDRYYD